YSQIFIIFTILTCALASYLDIPKPPQRPQRFKTRQQIVDYLKAVKDYYDAFKIKLVRREDILSKLYSNLENSDKIINNKDNQQSNYEEETTINSDKSEFDSAYHPY
ncbi:unnamed protein product, partial [Didymodactylos carnosus]